MFSFLPHDYKKKVMHIYRTRLSILYLIGLILISIFSVAMLVPAYMISISRKVEVTAEFDALKKTLDLKKNNDTESFINEASQKIKASVSSGSKGYISDVIENLINHKGSDIALSDISFSKNQDGLNISISGVALTRDGLLNFVKNLKSADSFKNVDLPVATLAKDKNISFNIAFQSTF